jgi:hypothetical protein
MLLNKRAKASSKRASKQKALGVARGFLLFMRARKTQGALHTEPTGANSLSDVWNVIAQNVDDRQKGVADQRGSPPIS